MEIEKTVGALAQLLQTEIQMTKKRQQYENSIKVPNKKWVAWTWQGQWSRLRRHILTT